MLWKDNIRQLALWSTGNQSIQKTAQSQHLDNKHFQSSLAGAQIFYPLDDEGFTLLEPGLEATIIIDLPSGKDHDW